MLHHFLSDATRECNRQFENRDHTVYVLWNKEQVNTFIRMVGGTFGD